MRPNRTVGIRMLALATSLALGAAPALAQTPTARQKPTAVKPVAAAAETQPAAKPSGGTQEAIKVHGDWTIVIRNEDGSVAARHEFQNALASSNPLPTILAHGGSVGRWEIILDGPIHPCSGPFPVCRLRETGNAVANNGEVKVSVNANTLLMVGSVQAQNASQITLVATSFVVCAPSLPPSIGCNPGFFYNFTQKDVTSFNINVGANQTMDVTVIISFS